MTDATGKKIEFILILLALMVLVLLSKKLEKYASGEIVKLTEKEKKSADDCAGCRAWRK